MNDPDAFGDRHRGQGTVIGTLLNFHGAVARMGAALNEAPYGAPPRAPVLYVKPRNTFATHGATIVIPADVREIEVGVTLGVVIGRTATRLTESDALEYVRGYTVVNDLTVPHGNYFRPAMKARCRDGFCPMGSREVPRAAIPDPDALQLRAYVNGDLRQENSTRNLVRPIARLIADVTEFMTLSAGDVLLVGVPEDSPTALAGDRVAVEIEGVGRVENMLVSPAGLP